MTYTDESQENSFKESSPLSVSGWEDKNGGVTDGENDKRRNSGSST